MSLESPPRLKHGELGAILRAADENLVTPERLAHNGAAVRSAIAAGVATASFPLWKLGVPLLLVLGLGAGARQLAIVDGEEAVPQPALDVPATRLDVVEPATSGVAYELAVPAPVEPPPTRRARTVAPVVDPVPPPPPPSELPEQIRLYEAARAASARGQHAEGLAQLGELLRRFPSTPLRADAELTRAELLTRADRLAEAALALEALAGEPAHRGRRGELLRTLGDVRRKQADCTRAVAAYTRARAERLSATEHAKVQRGLDRCARK